MAPIYTRTGDAGETGLFGGGRVPKAHPRVEAYGEVDELNAALGWVAAVTDDAELRSRLARIQADLFAIGAHLATPDAAPGRKRPELPPLPEERVPEFERWIDEATSQLPELRVFILPGGSPAGAALHLARTICRRAERRVVALARAEAVQPSVLAYLNRLSDLLFVLARVANRRAGVDEITWESAHRG
ncbi:MAG: cob(I)yrinic acid a,c-diamide adenosyltransferase [Gemmatimonadetes bacterium]|nr:cob(I)yrinic acid a,c-diamide adenosyltransferase [Gemmatimonadota bacterium]